MRVDRLVACPAPPGVLKHVADLSPVQRFGEHVVPAQIQHLRPQNFVRQAGRDDQQRRTVDGDQPRQQIFPTAVRQARLADRYRSRIRREKGKGFGLIARGMLLPGAMLENLT
jgi:hypothetical protein